MPSESCRSCGAAATCIGAYEGGAPGLGCDECCGHGNEDGWCVPLDPDLLDRSDVMRLARNLLAAEREPDAEVLVVNETSSMGGYDYRVRVILSKPSIVLHSARYQQATAERLADMLRGHFTPPAPSREGELEPADDWSAYHVWLASRDRDLREAFDQGVTFAMGTEGDFSPEDADEVFRHWLRALARPGKDGET